MHEVSMHGVGVPSLGLGTWELTGDTCYEAVRDALDIGYRHVDTAQAYANEQEVGRALADSGVDRDAVFLTTKLWRSNLSAAAVRASTEQSLRALATDRVDLLLVHWPVDDVPLGETCEAMLQLRDEGKTRAIGVSNFTVAQVREAARIAPVFANQVEYHPLLSQAAMLDLAEELDFMVTAYSPIAQGRVAGEDAIVEIARHHGKTAAQVALRWLVQQPRVAAIPRSSSAERRRENFDVFDFELDDDEVKAISGCARDERLIDPPFGPNWDD